MSKHHVEVYVDCYGIGSRLICEDEATCSETRPDYRSSYGCAIREWYENVGPELLDFSPTEIPVGRIPVWCDWRGVDDDADLHLRHGLGRLDITAPRNEEGKRCLR